MRLGWIWIAFLASILGGAVLVSVGRLASGLALLSLPVIVTTVLTLLYYLRERRKGAGEGSDEDPRSRD